MNPTLAELQEQLEEAQNRAEDAHAAILANGDSADEQLIADLEARFDEAEAEVRRIASAIDRKQRLADALANAPHGQGDAPANRNDGRGPANRNDGRSPARVLNDGRSPARVLNEPLTYRPTAEGGRHSFLADLYHTRLGQPGAAARLERHEREMAMLVQNAITTGAGSGGAFVPPQHLQELWAEEVRAGRPFANAVRNLDLPDVGMSMTVPQVTQGTTTGSQDAENTDLPEQDLESDDITIPVRTIGGYGEASRQSLDRSQPGLDEVIFSDMVRDYARTLNRQLISGTGLNGQHKGVLSDANRIQVTFTSASPKVMELYAEIGEAAAKVADETGRGEDPTGIFMHTRRWFWILSSADADERPLVAPVGPANAPGQFATAAEGAAGTLMGYPVFVDRTIPTTLGAGTNEDRVIVSRLDDNILWEAEMPTVELSDHVGFKSLKVAFRLFAYSAFTTERYSKANASIAGTGLVDPFA